jgi:hypothetical protein
MSTNIANAGSVLAYRVERSISDWYSLYHKAKRQFLTELPALDCVSLIARLQTDSVLPPLGRVRTKKELERLTHTREKPKDLAQLRGMRPTELVLKWMFAHRGYFSKPTERLLWWELPSCCHGTKPSGPSWADLLIMDQENEQPILVELKCSSANDPLSATIVEALTHWCF